MTLSTTDLLRREWYLFRFSWPMQDYPQRQYRQVRRELRESLTAAAQDVGMRRAVADLGHPRTLAEGYIGSLGRRLPRWTTGSVAAGGAVAVVLYLLGAYGVGVLDVLDAQGGGTFVVESLGARTTFTATDSEMSVMSDASWQWAALLGVLAIVVFALAARVWRALPRS